MTRVRRLYNDPVCEQIAIWSIDSRNEVTFSLLYLKSVDPT